MRYQKQVLARLEKCYAVTAMEKDGMPCILAAGEKQAPCLVFDLTGKQVDKVWDGPGGVMTMMPVPGEGGAILSTQDFYSPDESTQAKLVCAVKKEGSWTVTKVADVPFVHRFDIFPVNGVNHILVCTLKSGQEYPGDWSAPGRLLTGIIPEDPMQPLELQVLMEGLGHNHGYTRYQENGRTYGIVSCDQGVFQVAPPRGDLGWQVEQLLDYPSSDTIKLDLDGDGEPELLTLSPFHGDTLRIWRKEVGAYRVAFAFPEKLPFLHAIYAGDIYGTPMVFVGHREGKRLMLGFYYDKARNAYGYDVLDQGCGAANCMIFQRNGHPALLTTNREVDEVAVYDILP